MGRSCKDGYTEPISKVNKAVTEARNIIKSEHAEVNLEEVRGYLLKCGEALRGDRYDEAFELAKKAQLAAKPNTDYLLSKAGVLVGNAETRLYYHPHRKSEFMDSSIIPLYSVFIKVFNIRL